MISLADLTPGAPVRGVVRPVPVRWHLAGRVGRLPRDCRVCCPLPMGSCHGLAGVARGGRRRVVPKQSP